MFEFDGILWQFAAVLVGACVGSFLNVAIYRVPRGLKVNNPKRSFCPGCKTQIPWWRNIPIITWITQGGKCASCRTSIPPQYLVVEVLTAALFGLVWYLYPGAEGVLGWILIGLLVGISFIDGEHYVIPVDWCWWGVAIGILGNWGADLLKLGEDGFILSADWFWLPHHKIESVLSAVISERAVYNAIIGMLVGYFGLAIVVLLGKVMFGKKTITSDTPEPWNLKEPETDEEELQFVMGEESIGWSDIFYRKSDRLELTGSDFLVDGNPVAGEQLTIHEFKVKIGEEDFPILNLKSLEGRATEVVIPREAMGGGDPPLMALIGAFLGAPAVCFTIFCASLYAILAAVLGRVGFGKPLPFGPFLALGATTWILGGHKLVTWYVGMLGL